MHILFAIAAVFLMGSEYVSAEQGIAQAPPVFYRAGESIQQNTPPPIVEEEVEEFFEPESPFDALQEEIPVEEVFPEPEVFPEQPPIDIPTELDGPPYEEYTEEPPQPVEELPQRSSASSGSLALKLLSRMKYIAAAVVLLAVAFVFFFKKKKKAAAPAAASVSTEDVVPSPDKAQHVEQSSERLEHALEAMGENEEVTPPKEEGDDTVGFSAVEPPKE